MKLNRSISRSIGITTSIAVILLMYMHYDYNVSNKIAWSIWGAGSCIGITADSICIAILDKLDKIAENLKK